MGERRMLMSATVMVLLAACSSATQGGSGAPRRNSNVISAEEIAASPASTALDLVRQLRPSWLTERGARGTGDAFAAGAETSRATEGPAGVVVYRDGVRVGTFPSLGDIMAETLREVRWINGRDATTRFGTGHGGGVIEVLTRR